MTRCLHCSSRIICFLVELFYSTMTENDVESSQSDICELFYIYYMLPKKHMKHKHGYDRHHNGLKRLVSDESDQSSLSKDDEGWSSVHYDSNSRSSLYHDIPMYYIVPIYNGKKQGYGEIHFRGEYEDYVYSTSWINDIRSKKGFLYNRKTSKVLCLRDGDTTITFDETNCPQWEILDKDNGERWEGFSYRGSPCGYGEYYDENNYLVYRGMCVDFYWEGYGKSYFPRMVGNKPQLASEGMWCHGSLLGLADRFDLFGNSLLKGLLLNQEMYEFSLVISGSDFSMVSCFLEELVVANNSLNAIQIINLGLFSLLQRFVVGDNCCKKCRRLIVAHNNVLTTILIGDYSFTTHGNSLELLLSDSNTILRKRKAFLIRDVPKLETLQIGVGSFSDFCELSITEAPKLISIGCGRIGQQEKQIGISCCFFYCSRLYLKGLPRIETVKIGDFSFYHANSLLFCNLPKLLFIVVGSGCFFRSLHYKGRLILQDLPSLIAFTSLEQSFVSIYSLTIKSKYLSK